MSAGLPWWRGAVVYQVYIRSFCDANGDGQGDLPGLISKLDYIAKLGVDAIWLSPVHPSPNRDWGYDVADYEGVHPDYGGMDDFIRLIKEAHAAGLKIILDEVLCHTSDEHAWFRESMHDAKGAKADWYVWADAKLDGTAPNNWLSAFGGPAWAYQPARRQYYHHKFLRQQPKLNWHNTDARKAALDVLDLWLARGVDGYRLDVADAYLHDQALTDNPPVPLADRNARVWSHAPNLQKHLHDSNRPENIEALDAIRRVVERYPDRFVFGEFAENAERAGGYLPPTAGLHAGYTFALLQASRLAPRFVRDQFGVLARFPEHWPCISFSNHDVARTVTRFGGGFDGNPALAKLLLALLLSLRGTTLLYQGEELGLPEVDLRRDQLRDPVGDLYYPVQKGRDGCRTPMPWDGDKPNFGFGSGTPWLPFGTTHRPLAVAAQELDANSTLHFARRFIAGRGASLALRSGSMTILETPEPVLAFLRSEGSEHVFCVFNMSNEGAELSDDRIARAAALDIGCGEALAKADRLALGPLAAWFGKLD